MKNKVKTKRKFMLSAEREENEIANHRLTQFPEQLELRKPPDREGNKNTFNYRSSILHRGSSITPLLFQVNQVDLINKLLVPRAALCACDFRYFITTLVLFVRKISKLVALCLPSTFH